MEIQARRWLAVRYKCPQCGAHTAQTRITPTKKHRDDTPECWGYKCNHCAMEIVERKYYTTFAIDTGLSGTMVAGTLEKLGPFKVCDIVHTNIRSFRKWYEQAKAERDEKSRIYFEEQKRIQNEIAERDKQRQAQEALIKEAQLVAHRRAHAVELLAEQVARAAWGEEEKQEAWDDGLGELDEHPF